MTCKVCGYKPFDSNEDAPYCWECGVKIRNVSTFSDLPKSENITTLMTINAKKASAPRQIILRMSSVSFIKNNILRNFHFEEIQSAKIETSTGLFNSSADIILHVWEDPKNNNLSTKHRIRFDYSQYEQIDKIIKLLNKAKEDRILENIAKENNKKREAKKKVARTREVARDYNSAIDIWEELGEINEAARVRKLQAEMGSVKVAQNVVQGDQVTKTEIKDSVLNRSNIGSGSTKMQELRELKEMFDSGFISKEEMENMKKEILGK